MRGDSLGDRAGQLRAQDGQGAASPHMDASQRGRLLAFVPPHAQCSPDYIQSVMPFSGLTTNWECAFYVVVGSSSFVSPGPVHPMWKSACVMSRSNGLQPRISCRPGVLLQVACTSYQAWSDARRW